MKFIDGILAPGVLSGKLFWYEGNMFFQESDAQEPKKVNMTVGQWLFYSRIQKLRKLEKRHA